MLAGYLFSIIRLLYIKWRFDLNRLPAVALTGHYSNKLSPAHRTTASKTPAVSKLPVETWQTILRYVIFVPDFLDPDAYEGMLSTEMWTENNSPLNDERVYGRAERTRNRLRRVAKSWDRYLRRFEHRFVRMLDICCGTVLPEKLKNAVRISFGTYDLNGSRTDFQTFLFRNGGEYGEHARGDSRYEG